MICQFTHVQPLHLSDRIVYYVIQIFALRLTPLSPFK